jgi:hypothetical protein
MKYRVLGNNRLIYLVLALVLLLVSLVPMAMAQEPEEEGDVGAAFSLYGSVVWDVPFPGTNRLDGFAGGASELILTDMEDLAAADFVVDYPAAFPFFLDVANVEPGDLLGSLVPGQDYDLRWCVLNGVGPPPLRPCPPGTVPPDGGRGLVGPNDRLSISLVLFDHVEALQGTGSIVRIAWNTAGAAPPTGVGVVNLQNAVFTDRDGNLIHPCSLIPGVPAPQCPAPAWPLAQNVTVEVFDFTIHAEVTFEGFKGPAALPLPTVDWETMVGGAEFPCGLDATASHWECSPGVDAALRARRRGYLPAKALNIPGGWETLPNVTLLAGDVAPWPQVFLPGQGCPRIDIFDIQLIAANLNQPVGFNVVRQSMDYNSNGRVDIADLALAAKNFGRAGVLDWRTGQLICEPFPGDP